LRLTLQAIAPSAFKFEPIKAAVAATAQSWQVAIVMFRLLAPVPGSNFRIETQAFNAGLK
jgi:hypothetical protein